MTAVNFKTKLDRLEKRIGADETCDHPAEIVIYKSEDELAQRKAQPCNRCGQSAMALLLPDNGRLQLPAG